MEVHGVGDAIETALRIAQLTWTRVDTLMFGCMLALIQTSSTTWSWFIRAAPAFGLLAACALALPLPAALDYSWIALLFTAVIAFCVSLDERRRELPVLHARPLRYLGTVSYAVYVFHFLLILLVGRWLRGAGVEGIAGFPLALIAVAASSLLLATISQRFIEQPALALKRHFPLYSPTVEFDHDAPAGAVDSSSTRKVPNR
jgi:peptidoglycan/LPS O-acetylase OafA/YrhL